MEIPQFFETYHAQVWVVGSTMYGMNTPDSDVDFTGVFHNPYTYMDPFNDRLVTKTNDTNDYSLHTAAKMANMLVKGNFNAIDLVFHKPVKEEVFVSGMFEAAAPYALTRNVAKAYMGYVNSQKNRLIGHKPQSPERKAQIARLGYDPKYAAHLLRGMYTLKHILDTGEYLYLSGDLLKLLVSVKLGELSHEEVEERIESLVPELEKSYNERLEFLPEAGLLEDILREYFISFA